MKPYPRYKPTGLAWLPAIPEHWEVKRLQNLFEERKEANREGKTTRVLSLLKDVGVIPYEDKGNIGNKSKEDITQYKIAHKGDLVLNSMNVIIGSVGVSKYDGCVSPVYYALRPRKGTNAKYYEHVMRLANVQKVIRGRANGILEIRLRISAGALLDLPFPLPPPPEQDRIVRYLDEKTAAIDELVRAKEREIELLRERKQALVSAAVKRGLDSATKLKDSGDPFTGAVPHNWNATPLHSCSHVVSKRGNPQGELLSIFLNLGVVRFSDMGEKRANATSLDLTNYQEVNPGDLVLNNQQAWRGSVGVSKLSGIVSPAYVVVELDESWDADFANYFFRAPHMVAHYVVASKGVGSIQRIIDWNEMKNLKVFRPDKAEQKQIADHLGLACKRCDDLETACRKQISLIQELRTRLVSDAVTGAVEVTD